MVLLGDVSYSFYLWHWPFLVLAPAAIGFPWLDWHENLAVAAAALIVAVVTYRLVEQPARRLQWPPRRWFFLAAGMTAVTLLVLSIVWLSLPRLSGPAAPAVRPDLAAVDTVSLPQLLTQAMANDLVPANLTPPLAEPPRFPFLGGTASEPCFVELREVEQESCVFGTPSSSRRIVLLGDSHAWQWRWALDALGREYNWRVEVWAKAWCGVADVEPVHSVLQRPYTECTRWREARFARIAEEPPDLIIVSQSDSLWLEHFSPDEWAEATLRSVQRLQSSTSDVRYLEDTPSAADDIPGCVADQLTSVSRCALAAQPVEPVEARWDILRPQLESLGADVVPTREWFCIDEGCPAVVADLLVYRDASHVSDEYATFLAPILRSALAMDDEPHRPRAMPGS